MQFQKLIGLCAKRVLDCFAIVHLILTHFTPIGVSILNTKATEGVTVIKADKSKSSAQHCLKKMKILPHALVLVLDLIVPWL